MVHRRSVPYYFPPFSDLLHPEDDPSQGPHELPANPIHVPAASLMMDGCTEAPTVQTLCALVICSLRGVYRLIRRVSSSAFRKI